MEIYRAVRETTARAVSAERLTSSLGDPFVFRCATRCGERGVATPRKTDSGERCSRMSKISIVAVSKSRSRVRTRDEGPALIFTETRCSKGNILIMQNIIHSWEKERSDRFEDGIRTFIEYNQYLYCRYFPHDTTSICWEMYAREERSKKERKKTVDLVIDTCKNVIWREEGRTSFFFFFFFKKVHSNGLR